MCLSIVLEIVTCSYYPLIKVLVQTFVRVNMTLLSAEFLNHVLFSFSQPTPNLHFEAEVWTTHPEWYQCSSQRCVAGD